MASREVKALRRSHSVFTRGTDPDAVITALYSLLLLTPEEKQRATHETLTPNKQLDKISVCLERRVSANPSVFHKVVQMLLKEPALEEVGKQMQAFYDEEQSDTVPSSPPKTHVKRPPPPDTSTNQIHAEKRTGYSPSLIPSPSPLSPPKLNLRTETTRSHDLSGSSGAAAAPASQDGGHQMKLVVLGEPSVGKTSLLLRFAKGKFSEVSQNTVKADIFRQTVNLDDGTTITFTMVDTAGQEKHNSLTPQYYRGLQAAIVVYDITNKETFWHVNSWVEDVKRRAEADTIIALAGNKIDLAYDGACGRAVDIEVAQRYADENGLLFKETSAKTDENVDELFRAIAQKLPQGAPGPQNGNLVVELSRSGRTPRRKFGCCRS